MVLIHYSLSIDFILHHFSTVVYILETCDHNLLLTFKLRIQIERSNSKSSVFVTRLYG